jgi:hypothetical protein
MQQALIAHQRAPELRRIRGFFFYEIDDSTVLKG